MQLQLIDKNLDTHRQPMDATKWKYSICLGKQKQANYARLTVCSLACGVYVVRVRLCGARCGKHFINNMMCVGWTLFICLSRCAHWHIYFWPRYHRSISVAVKLFNQDRAQQQRATTQRWQYYRATIKWSYKCSRRTMVLDRHNHPSNAYNIHVFGCHHPWARVHN